MIAEPTIDLDTWSTRIDQARTRRDKWITLWSEYARLHTNAYLVAKAENDDAQVVLPNGDQVKLGLVHRNVEQTMALLEVPEIGVRVTAVDYSREVGAEDTHREGVVEAALVRSLKRSGFVKSTEESDAVKRDGVVIGHGINYTWWRKVTREVELEHVAVMAEQDDGSYAPELTEAGEPLYEALTEQHVVWSEVQDLHVLPTEFLFDAQCNSMPKSTWHGMEKIVKASELARDPTIEIPPDIKPTSFRVRDLYGSSGREEVRSDDAYRQIVIWDKAHYELITLIQGKDERPRKPDAVKTRAGKGKKSGRELSYHIAKIEHWPVTFDLPDDSPFSFFIPISANDLPWGVSQVEHIRTPSNEADKTRTRLANMVRQTRRIPWYIKGRVDDTQLAAAFNGTSGDPVGIDLQEGEKIEQIFGELPIPGVDPDLYKASKEAEVEIPLISGVPEAPFSGAGTATESENIMSVGGARAQRKRRLYLGFATDVARKHKDFRREFDPPGQTITVVGPDGVALTLEYGREAFQGDLEVEFLPGGEAMSVSPVRQKMLIEASNLVLGRFSPKFDRIYIRELFTQLDIRNINAMLDAMPVDAMQYMNMHGGVDGKARAGAFTPEDQTNGQAIRAATNAASEGAMV